MSFEIKEDFAKEQNLTPEQVTAITGNVTTYHDAEVATLKQEWDGKANTDAEGILNGAASKIEKDTGVSREQGEKMADYILRSHTEFSKDKTTALETATKEYQDKVANFKGNDDVVNELESYKTKYSDLQKKEAEFDTLNDSGVQTKYDELLVSFNGLNIDTSFNGVKPNFPQDANQYEVSAKWNEFKKEVLTTYDIKIVEGEALAISKENQHKQVKLKDLVSENTALKDLMAGRKQDGINAKQTDYKEVEGVPFKVPVNVDAKELTKLVQEQLTKENISKTSMEYPKRFAAMYNKAKQKTAE